MIIDEIVKIPPFSLGKEEKKRLLSSRLLELTQLHMKRCPEYASMLRGIGFDAEKCTAVADIPFLPVSLFKQLELKSIPQEDVFKVTTSSGTAGQAVSRIYLDKAAASIQQKVLVKIVSEFIGKGRIPMLIIDSPAVISNRATFSARGAGIAGFSIFGSDKAYALDADMHIDLPTIDNFLAKHSGKKILLFGFTFIIWQHFYKELTRLGRTLDICDGVLIHGGGWKKLLGEAVSKDEFKKRLGSVCGTLGVHDYYGMAEQTGSIYMECEHGHLHASVFSDVITRRAVDFSPCDIGEPGIIQIVSVLPESYPGHSLLTEDEGVILGEDDCPCGRKGKYFQVNGRLKMAEIRGCSDTYVG